MTEEQHNKKQQEIVYSNAVKAGKRIYYIDVKRSSNNDLYIAVTESKKKINGEGENAQITFEKHKIFLYKEDFENFKTALDDVMNFIKNQDEDTVEDKNLNDVSTENKNDTSKDNAGTKKYDIDINFDI